MELLSQKLKDSLVEHLLSASELDTPYLIQKGLGKTTWTKRELAQEIQDETPFGVEQMRKLLSLTLDLLAREKYKNDRLELEQKYIDGIAAFEETGMGYHIVKIFLKDGTCLSDRVVVNGSLLVLKEGETLDNSQIDYISLSK